MGRHHPSCIDPKYGFLFVFCIHRWICIQCPAWIWGNFWCANNVDILEKPRPPVWLRSLWTAPKVKMIFQFTAIIIGKTIFIFIIPKLLCLIQILLEMSLKTSIIFLKMMIYSSISSSNTYYVYIGTYFFSVCVSRLNHVMSHKVGQMMWIWRVYNVDSSGENHQLSIICQMYRTLLS